ncbi:OLC1v1036657C2 [Oldenlandia corymbosa var. corymbosa]|uniref:OLC1v1036657C2 n=1 Tax=Oldenlandia corymbosa var. corymbosa TaxID=529605 RepID=A0AAV1CXC2_OLDCO|nr:OLC1v1036657C2 [Oldenlandia corymbosa var. corymbosa]
MSPLLRGSSWQPTIPSWEKKFCKDVGSFDWATLVDMKKYVYLYENVVNWDDSAGKEAFQNAKKRFLANMHGHPCDISLPDPDLFIDEVDWDSEINPELLNDLEDGSSVHDMTAETEPVVIFGDGLLQNQGYSVNGWGDIEEDMKAAVDSNNNPWLGQTGGAARDKGWGEISYNAGATSMNGGEIGAAGWPKWQNQGGSFTGWGNAEEDSKDAWNSNITNHYNPWEQTAQEDGWGHVGAAEWTGNWENTWSGAHPDNQKKYRNRRTENPRARGTWDAKNTKSNASRRQMSSYRTSRVHGDEQKGDYAWKGRMSSHNKAACF